MEPEILLSNLDIPNVLKKQPYIYYSKMVNSKLIFMLDGTGSMGNFLGALKISIRQILTQVEVYNNLDISILIYRDYDCKVIDYCNCKEKFESWLKYQSPHGGKDQPEATKTALVLLKEKVNIDNNTLIIHYTDAGPHYGFSLHPNFEKEKNTLTEFNWHRICEMYKNVNFINVVTNNISYVNERLLSMLGPCVSTNQDSSCITKLSTEIILECMGLLENKEYEFTRLETYESEKFIDENSNTLDVLSTKRSKKGLNTIEGFKVDLSCIKNKFKEDKNYRDHVYNIFENLVNADDIESITYNVIFGTMWRLICNRIKTPDERSIKLADKMGKVVSLLYSDKKDKVKKWLEDSYDNTEYINDLISEVTLEPEDDVIILTDINVDISKRDLVNVMNLKSSFKEMSEVINFLCGLSNVKYKDIKDDTLFVPMKLNNFKLFSIITHLISPGLTISFQGVNTMAAFVYMSNNSLLIDKAKEILETNVGKWINFEYPEFYTYNTISVVKKITPFLTDTEKELFENMDKIFKIRNNLNKTFEIETPFNPPGKAMKLYDHKVKCEECNQMRSTTTMYSKNECGSCFYKKTNPDDKTEYENEYEELEKSNLFECHCCACIYAVNKINDLNVKPKCYFCRIQSNESVFSQVLPKVQCESCFNFYIDGARFYDKTFTCAECEHHKKENKIDVVSLTYLFENFSSLISLFGITSNDDDQIKLLLSNMSMYKIYDKIKFVKNEKILIENIKVKKPVLNLTNLIEKMIHQVNEGSTFESCLLCCEEKHSNNFTMACGNCNNRICNECLGKWYGSVTPGNVLLFSYLKCPFCKMVPKYKIVKNVNRLLPSISKKIEKYNTNDYYAWCNKCYKIEFLSKRECSRDTPVLNGGFSCKECKQKITIFNSVDVKTKNCPECDVSIEKDGGCNHISCVCGTHMCWLCNYKSDSGGDVYDHLYDYHGGCF
jgi:hypothetical protein